MRVASFEISGTWDGNPLAAEEFARVELVLDAARSEVTVVTEAAFYADPKPAAAPGRLDGLWNFEVVELFLLGANHRYLELEFGPHGHCLALYFRDQRVPDSRVLDLSFAVEVCEDGPAGGGAGRWRGRARFDAAGLPEGLFAANAYAIHDRRRAAEATSASPVVSSQTPHDDGRRYLAMHPVPGSRPDFHRLDCFRPIDFR